MGFSNESSGKAMKKFIAFMTSIALMVYLNFFAGPSQSSALEVKQIENETACLNELVDLWKGFGTPYPCFPQGTTISLPIPSQVNFKPTVRLMLELNSSALNIPQNSNRINLDRFNAGLNKAQFVGINSLEERYPIGEPYWFIGYAANSNARTSTVVKKSYVLSPKGSVSIQNLATSAMNLKETEITELDDQGVRQVFKSRVYSADLTSEQVATLTKSGNVEVISNTIVYPSTDQANPPSWGLDRIDQTSLPLNRNYKYVYQGTGVNAYIIDTGINNSHQEFTGRIPKGAWVVQPGITSYLDCNGHGTHVAGTIGGSKYGVAKNVKLIPVRVFGCSGGTSTASVVAAMDWVVSDHATTVPAVVNMSLGGGADSASDAGVIRLVNDGVVTVVAAGNSGANSCNYSPARAPSAITVGSSTSLDKDSDFSNIGSCVDIFAPGSSITSAWIGSTTATASISGTSMAAPHVAGVAAMILQRDFANYTNKSLANSLVTQAMLNGANVGKLTACCSSSWYPSTVNKLLNTGFLNGSSANTKLPSITGIPRVGQTLTASKGTWTGAPAPALTYQWVVCSDSSSVSSCTNIAGATTMTYRVLAGQQDKYVRIVEFANRTESVYSQAYPCNGMCLP
jgi:subtilisin family serine protease